MICNKIDCYIICEINNWTIYNWQLGYNITWIHYNWYNIRAMI